MSVLSFAQILRSYFLFSTIGFTFICNEVFATSCQTHPSEYAYHDYSVTRAESLIANCRNYPDGPNSQEQYILCDGSQLRLTDSNLGQEQYKVAAYYSWSAGRDAQLLFIFHTRVSLTTITLHYYSDSCRGLPRLRFYAVPDYFDIWEAPTTWYPRVDVAAVPSGGEPAGQRNIRINANFSTMKVLMYKYSSSFLFSVSEVEFFQCSAVFTITEGITIISKPTTATIAFTKSATKHFTIPPVVTTSNTESFESTEDESYRTQSSSSNQIRSNSAWTRELVAWVLVVILAILLIVSLTNNGIQAIWTRKIWRNNKNDTSPERAVAMDSNPCYEASNLKPTESQEAVHIYETVKQHN